MSDKKDTAISIRPSPDLKVWLEAQAAENFRSVNQQVLYLLEQARRAQEKENNE